MPQRVLRGLGWTAMGAIIALLLITTTLTCILLFPVREAALGTPHDYGLPCEALRFRVDADCTLAAWFLPNPASQGRTVVVLHGVSANKAEMLPHAAAIYKMGYNVLMLDQRRHGDSTGRFATYGWLERHDLDAAILSIEKRPDVQPGVVVVGYSMGAAIALQSLGDAQIRGVVADSSFADLPSMLAVRSEQWHVPSWPFINLCEWEAGLVFDVTQVSPLAVLHAVNKPVLLIHGGHDRSIPLAQARRLAAAGAGHVALWVVPEADHIASADCRPVQYYARVREFIARAFAAPAVAAR